jgi:hypothetical protein
VETANLFPPRTPFPTSRPAAETAINFPARSSFPTTRPESTGAGAPAPSNPANAKVEIVSLAVSKLPGQAGEALRTKWGFRPDLLFREQGGGTALRLLVSAPDRTLVEIDPLAVKIDRFVDDTGHELSTAIVQDNRNVTPIFAPLGLYNISTDGHNALFRLVLEDAPSADATRFVLRGSAEVRVGVNQQTAEQKDLPIEVGSAIKAGPITLTVKTIASQYNTFNNPNGTPPEPANAPVMLTLSSTHEPKMIHKIEVLDADGRPVSANFTWPAPPRYSDPKYRPTSHTCYCTLGHDLKKATVRVTYFERLESATVPIQVTGGVGL